MYCTLLYLYLLADLEIVNLARSKSVNVDKTMYDKTCGEPSTTPSGRDLWSVL